MNLSKSMRILIILLALVSISFSKEKCIESVGVGEAPITKYVSSAKMEAYARAKWDAVEKALGTHVFVKDVVENFKLLDEVVTKDVKGFIKNPKIIEEKREGNTLIVKVKGCVYPEKAKKAIGLITKNTVFNVIFLIQDRSYRYSDEMNPITTKLIDIFSKQGFKVQDLASIKSLDTYEIENALYYRRFFKLRKLLEKTIAGVTIIGKVNFIRKIREGQDIGYGFSPFSIIYAQANYYVLIKDKGKIRILASGSMSAKGVAINEDMAKDKALEALADKLAEDIYKKIYKYLSSHRKVVTVVVDGIKSLSENFEIKSKIQKLPWVKSVKDVGIGKFEVEYLDNPVYLANALESLYGYKVEKFSPLRIVIKYKN